MCIKIFQSTHLREVRLEFNGCLWRIINFNPRTYVRCDDLAIASAFNKLGISIHAPTWGATKMGLDQILTHKHFNPRTYVRCDTISMPIDNWSKKFQSTHLREVRLSDPANNPIIKWFQSTHLREVRRASAFFMHNFWRDFNPRTYVRCDLMSSWEFGSVLEFQSTHLREVRHVKSHSFIRPLSFQSTHLREVRLRIH